MTHTNTLLLEALSSKNQRSIPVWLMRQAGRYLSEYQAIRKKYTLLEMFHHPDLIVDVTLLPLKKFPLDAAIVFSDILTVLDGIGQKWHFEEGHGPLIDTPLRDLSTLQRKAPEETYAHLKSAIIELKKQLSVPLLGFAGAPFTIASYLIEGRTSKEWKQTKKWLYQNPQQFHALLDHLAEATIDYLNLQIAAGVDAIQLFDSWANALGIEEFREFSLKYLEKILKNLSNPSLPVILFCRGSFMFAKDLASLKPAALSLDWSGSMEDLRPSIPKTIAFQGNLDPACLYADIPHLKKHLDRVLSPFKKDPGYIFNLGHGILPDTPVDHVKFLVDYVHNYT